MIIHKRCPNVEQALAEGISGQVTFDGTVQYTIERAITTEEKIERAVRYLNGKGMYATSYPGMVSRAFVDGPCVVLDRAAERTKVAAWLDEMVAVYSLHQIDEVCSECGKAIGFSYSDADPIPLYEKVGGKVICEVCWTEFKTRMNDQKEKAMSKKSNAKKAVNNELLNPAPVLEETKLDAPEEVILPPVLEETAIEAPKEETMNEENAVVTTPSNGHDKFVSIRVSPGTFGKVIEIEDKEAFSAGWEAFNTAMQAAKEDSKKYKMVQLAADAYLYAVGRLPAILMTLQGDAKGNAPYIPSLDKVIKQMITDGHTTFVDKDFEPYRDIIEAVETEQAKPEPEPEIEAAPAQAKPKGKVPGKAESSKQTGSGKAQGASKPAASAKSSAPVKQTYTRIQSVCDVLKKDDKLASDKEALAKKADELYVKKGGPSNLKESKWAVGVAVGTLRAWGIIE